MPWPPPAPYAHLWSISPLAELTQALEPVSVGHEGQLLENTAG